MYQILIKNPYFITYSILLFFSCNEKKPKDIQNEVFNDIFSELIENSTQDFRKMVTPTPELIKLWREGKDIYKKEIKDKRKMLIVINDSIKAPAISENKKLNSLDPLYQFNFHEFDYSNENIHLVSNKTFLENQDKLKNDFHFGGFLDISQINFQSDLKSGYFTINYRCGKLCGQNNRIQVVLNSDKKWVIEKIETISVVFNKKPTIKFDLISFSRAYKHC